jgi:hypothetical protein
MSSSAYPSGLDSLGGCRTNKLLVGFGASFGDNECHSLHNFTFDSKRCLSGGGGDVHCRARGVSSSDRGGSGCLLRRLRCRRRDYPRHPGCCCGGVKVSVIARRGYCRRCGSGGRGSVHSRRFDVSGDVGRLIENRIGHGGGRSGDRFSSRDPRSFGSCRYRSSGGKNSPFTSEELAT